MGTRELREYNYEMTKHMTDEERMNYYNEGGRAFQREIDEARFQQCVKL